MSVSPASAPPVDLYDSDIVKINEVQEKLDQFSRDHGGLVIRGDFHRQIVERFEDIGFRVTIQWFETDRPGVMVPEITVQDRIEAHVFDPLQMRHEVINDIAGTGDEGTIKMRPEDFKSQAGKKCGGGHSGPCVGH